MTVFPVFQTTPIVFPAYHQPKFSPVPPVCIPVLPAPILQSYKSNSDNTFPECSVLSHPESFPFSHGSDSHKMPGSVQNHADADCSGCHI